MSAFHPYGPQDVRVVSDLSRFEFERATPRNRSRNTTPTSTTADSILDINHKHVNTNPPRQILEQDESGFTTRKLYPPKSKSRLLEAAKISPSNNVYEAQDDIYQYYMKPSDSQINDDASGFSPYPPSITGDSKEGHLPYNSPHAPVLAIPSIPPSHKSEDDLFDRKIINYENSLRQPQPKSPSELNLNKNLPPLAQPADYVKSRDSFSTDNSSFEKKPTRRSRKGRHNKGHDAENFEEEDTKSMYSRQKDMEEIMIRRVMNRPLLSFKLDKLIARDSFRDRDVTITANFVLYVFEIISAIILITLSAILSTSDNDIPKGIYRYFIADQIISLITALLFITTIINFEKRNGSFYCTAACLLTLVSFILVLSTVLVADKCPSNSLCAMRKAVCAFIIISTFIWISDLVMFITTLYISRLNLLDDINFDFSNSGTYNHPKQNILPNVQTTTDAMGSTSEPRSSTQDWPQYYMEPDGEIVKYNGSFNTTGVERLVVYLPYQ